MAISHYLYNEEYAKIKIFRVINLEDPYHQWKLEPVESDVLSVTQESDLSGLFVVKAFLVETQTKVQECYTDVILPERVSENAYLWIENQLIEKHRGKLEGDVIPQVAINHPGDYQLFYSRRNPELGIEILQNGLKLVEKKSAIAEDLAYILRDEQRHEEAIEAFSMVIAEEGAGANYFSFIERAQLLDRIGNHQKADDDWKMVEKLAGTQVVEIYREAR
jgi:hypothetical protein